MSDILAPARAQCSKPAVLSAYVLANLLHPSAGPHELDCRKCHNIGELERQLLQTGVARATKYELDKQLEDLDSRQRRRLVLQLSKQTEQNLSKTGTEHSG